MHSRTQMQQKNRCGMMICSHFLRLYSADNPAGSDRIIPGIVRVHLFDPGRSRELPSSPKQPIIPPGSSAFFCIIKHRKKKPPGSSTHSSRQLNKDSTDRKAVSPRILQCYLKKEAVPRQHSFTICFSCPIITQTECYAGTD